MQYLTIHTKNINKQKADNIQNTMKHVINLHETKTCSKHLNNKMYVLSNYLQVDPKT